MDILLLILGLVLIIGGANFFTDGASSIARRFGISDFIIGVTVVAIGTSMPELVVSVISVMNGSTDIAMGNIVGSNMFNTLVILGTTAIILPLPLSGNNIRKDIPFGVLASLVFLISAGDLYLSNSNQGIISRSEGLLMLCFLVVFLAYTIYSSDGNTREKTNPEIPLVKNIRSNIWISVLSLLGGLAALVYGGDLFIDNAVKLARDLGVSETVIGITLVAGGTSLPELATSVAAALKKNIGIALGNVLGSNVLNIFLVLGVTATINPLGMGGITISDILILTGSSVLVFVSAFTFKARKIDRAEGIIFLLLYVAYICWLIAR